MRPERAPGDKFLFFAVKNAVKLWVTKFKPIFLGKMTENLQPKIQHISPQISKFHHLELLGPLSCPIIPEMFWAFLCQRFQKGVGEAKIGLDYNPITKALLPPSRNS